MESTQSMIKSIVPAAIVAVALVVIALIARMEFNTYWRKNLEIVEKQIFVEAVDACAKIATTTWSDESKNATTIEPYNDAYERCLKDKGYK